MHYGFWNKLARPLKVLAPMSGVTDAAFRAIIAKYGKPDAMFTEFVPADGLCSVGRENIMHHLLKTEAEQPLVAQIYGSIPENYRGAAKFLVAEGFQGIDINMGCPAKPVERKQAGAALIKTPALARELIEATKDGAGDIPVSVKTRIGYRQSELTPWLTALLAARPAAITLHARTRNEKSKVPARWGFVKEAVEIARTEIPDPAERPLIIGNGDVMSLAEVEQRVAETGCDGVMIGRAIFGNPWLFNPDTSREQQSLAQIVEVMLEHTALYIELFAGAKPLELMKKHFKAYLSGFKGASKLRLMLMDAEDFPEINRITREALARHATADDGSAKIR